MVETACILENIRIARDTWKMVIQTTLAPHCEPGQFIEIQVPGYYLRRPISIAWIESGSLTILYKVMGNGTDAMTKLKANDPINIFGPLGNGFPIDETQKHITLIGGGIGVPPLLETARQYRSRNKAVQVVLGFNSKEDVFANTAFQELGCEVFIATMDGSLGTEGTVMDAIANHSIKTDFIEACGPVPMLRAIQNAYSNGYISMESRMACGMGACMGCVIQTVDGQKRVCKDGPVFELGKVVF